MQGALGFLLGLYAGLSVVALLVYAVDKWAAVKGRRRVPEKTLYLISLFGGWPGALLARLLFRHKTSKPGFVVLFWLTVVINLLVTGTFVNYSR